VACLVGDLAFRLGKGMADTSWVIFFLGDREGEDGGP